ncbi:hypothetical protein C8Q75DRAFT_761823 [Abortiporus biennis]|nr:hypothetical protein C8Q75DRAFT_761823 [Abortiporus biennis]
MRLRIHNRAFTIHLLLLWFLSLTQCIAGQSSPYARHRQSHQHQRQTDSPSSDQQDPTSHYNTNATEHFSCVPFGECEPCPGDALHEPFCQPFGNRRLVHCLPSSSGTPDPSIHNLPPSSSYSHPSTNPPLPPSHQGEIPAWESCGRIIQNERRDFYEFVACNVGIALLAVGVVFWRSRRLQDMQARQLAARIGLVRSAVPPGWSNG